MDRIQSSLAMQGGVAAAGAVSLAGGIALRRKGERETAAQALIPEGRPEELAPHDVTFDRTVLHRSGNLVDVDKGFRELVKGVDVGGATAGRQGVSELVALGNRMRNVGVLMLASGLTIGGLVLAAGRDDAPRAR